VTRKKKDGEGDKMTPPVPGFPASSELLASSSRSQGILGGGVSDGALLAPLCSHCHRLRERWDRDPPTFISGML